MQSHLAEIAHSRAASTADLMCVHVMTLAAPLGTD